MQEYSINKATEDIALIKMVIERTSRSLISFSQVFIWWGLVYLVANIIHICYFFSPLLFPGLNGGGNAFGPILQSLVILGLLFSYLKVKNRTPLVGLGKQLMNLWMIIIAFEILMPLLYRTFSWLFNINFFTNDITSQILDMSGYSIYLFLYAFGFLGICILTQFKLPAYFAIIYTLFGLLFTLPNPLLSIGYDSTVMQIFRFLVLGLVKALTFLTIGFYLKKQRVTEN